MLAGNLGSLKLESRPTVQNTRAPDPSLRVERVYGRLNGFNSLNGLNLGFLSFPIRVCIGRGKKTRGDWMEIPAIATTTIGSFPRPTWLAGTERSRVNFRLEGPTLKEA